MPMEHLRQRLINDASLYPDFAAPRQRAPISATSISSTDSESTSPSVASTASTGTAVTAPSPPRAAVNRVRKNYVIPSDEEEEEVSVADLLTPPPVKAASPKRTTSPSSYQQLKPSSYQQLKPFPPSKHMLAPVPIHVPSNRDLTLQAGSSSRPLPQGDEEAVDIHVPYDLYDAVAPAEAEKALRELVGGAINMDAQTEINPGDQIVNGFRDGIKLLPHQVLGRIWMREREDVTKKRMGGILADDMGLGKTIQTLTRIVEGRARKADKLDGYSATTLVICPLALVNQWADEIKRMVEGLRVHKHHGPSRTNDPSVLTENHVVITTYDVAKSEYEAYAAEALEGKPAGGKGKKKKASKGDEDNDDSDDSLANVKSKTKKAKKALYGVKWWRIVLDEAHNIKNEKTKGAIACCELQGKFRWCLTGTPMQNNVTELYSLLKFLRIKPLNDWPTFNEQIAKPVKSGRGATRAIKRLHVVLKQVMLRRQKDQLLNGQPLITLPQRNVNIVSCQFDSSEQVFYNALESKMGDVVEKLMGESGGRAYISVLLLLLRLRQACNHPILVASDYKSDIEAVEPQPAKKGTDDPGADAEDLATAFGQMGVTKKCQVCMSELTSSNTGEGEWKTHCVDCVRFAKQAKESRSKRPTSAKIRMILKLLRDVEQRSNGEEKTIIFSQFTSMLDLIEPFLKEEGVDYVRYDGSMRADEREIALNTIKTSKSTTVILISFKAGSTGLNLTACNNVILVDLWWNPALEDQAFDRAHRFGQTRDVNIFKLKIDATVEDRILELQEKKRALAAAALSGDKIKNLRLNMEELLALFRRSGGDEEDDDD